MKVKGTIIQLQNENRNEMKSTIKKNGGSIKSSLRKMHKRFLFFFFLHDTNIVMINKSYQISFHFLNIL